MYFQVFISLFVLTIVSCSHPVHAGRPSSPEDMKRKEIFLKARSGSSENACQLYQKLYADKDFPLKTLLAIRTVKNCSFPRTHTIALLNAIERNDLSEFLKEEFYLVGFEKLKKFQVFDQASRFAIEVSSRQRTSKDREDWLLSSLELAKESKDADVIKRAQAALEDKFPSYIPSPTTEQYYSVARDWEKKREFAKARSFYQKAFNSKALTSTERIDAHFRHAFTYRLDRNREVYAKELTKMTSWMRQHFGKEVENSSDKDLLEAYWARYILEAKAYWNIGDFDTCYKKLKDLSERAPNGKYKAEMLWTLGKMHLEKKELDRALEFYQAAFDIKADDDEINGKITWSLVWNHYLRGDYQKAVNIVDESQVQSTFVQAKLDFWKGRSLLKINQQNKAKEVFQKLASDDPYGFYGISSHYFLNDEMEAIDQPLPTTTLHYQKLDWLNFLDEKDLSRRFLEEVGQRMTEPEEISNLLPLYTESEFYSGGLLKFFRIPSDKRAPYLDKHITTVFPLAYLEYAEAESEKRAVPTPLIMGLIRQESAFDTFARSWADAFGLMQLLPERAKELAEQAGVEYHDFNDLYDPEKNIKLGTLLLSQYLKKWNHNFIGYIASYNAGSAAINRWLSSRYRKDPFEFVEMIPYEETQGYIKLIFRNYVTYLRLTGHDVKVNPEFLWNSKIKL